MPRPAIAARDIDVTKLGPNSPLRELLGKRRRTARRRAVEHGEQVKLFAWARDPDTIARHPEVEWLFAIPNFSGRLGRLTLRQGAILKAEGRKKGVSDVFLPCAHGGAFGLWIEMKAERRKPTREQRAFHVAMRAAGYATAVCYSSDAAIGVIVRYLHLPLTRRTT